MRVLITGADGQLGLCLQDGFAGTPHEIIPVGRRQMDITDPVAVFECVQKHSPDVIINAAAFTAVDKAESERDIAWAVNGTAVEHLVSAANQVSAMLVHVSTDYVFDGSSRRPYRESDPVNPSCVYGASKLAGERAAAGAMRYVVVRTAWVFSEYGNNFVKTMLRLARDRDSLSIVNDQTGAPTYAGDLADALIRLCEVSPANGVYHFSGGDSCTWFDFAKAIFDESAKLSVDFTAPSVQAIPTSDFPTPAKRPAYSVLDGSKLWHEASIGCGNWRKALGRVCTKLLS